MLVEITAFSDDDAYTIFETMNDRSTTLSRAMSSAVRNCAFDSIRYHLAFLHGLELCRRYPQSSAARIPVDRTSMGRLALPGLSAVEANQSLTCSTAMESTVI